MLNQTALRPATDEVRRYATFYVGDLFFGIEVQRVQELLRHQEITPVPLAPEVIHGLINLRGQIVTAVDMRRRLGLEPRQTDEPPMNVVLRTREEIVSLVVDAIGDVLEPPAESSEPPPATMRAEEKAIIQRVYKLEGKLLLALSAHRLLEGLCTAVAQSGSEQ